jgi:hypothetical protein
MDCKDSNNHVRVIPLGEYGMRLIRGTGNDVGITEMDGAVKCGNREFPELLFVIVIASSNQSDQP